MAVPYTFVQNRTVAVIGVPFRGGQPKQGTEAGPQVMRENGVVSEILASGWKVEDKGDTEIPQLVTNDMYRKTKNVRSVGKANENAYRMVRKSAEEGNFVLTIGGDHSVAVGTVSGILSVRPNTCVVWTDAHADINDHTTTDTGNMHGMPVSFLLNQQMRSTPGFEWMETENVPILPPERIAYVGLRDVDEPEKRILKDYGIAAFSMQEIDEYGINSIMKQVIKAINPKKDLPIHLSFDVDGIDAAVTPATGTAVMGGLSYRESRQICDSLASTGLLSSMDIMEINPLLSDEPGRKMTINTAKMLVKHSLGAKLL